MKKEYQKLEMEVIVFDAEDVITDSPVTDGDVD